MTLSAQRREQRPKVNWVFTVQEAEIRLHRVSDRREPPFVSLRSFRSRALLLVVFLFHFVVEPRACRAIAEFQRSPRISKPPEVPV